MRKTDTKTEKAGNAGIEKELHSDAAKLAETIKVAEADQEQEADQDIDQGEYANSFDDLEIGRPVIYCDASGVDHRATVTGKHEGQRLDLVVHAPGNAYDLGTVAPAASADQKEAWYFITE